MKIVLGVTGSIAAYKALDLIRQLKAAGHEVRVVMTHSAKAFVTPLSFATLSEYPVYSNVFELENPMRHIELAKWADLVLIAPASAHTLSVLAAGGASDLLTNICLATRAPVWLAPAMNQAMWQHPATQKNILCLESFAYRILPVDEGEQACGDIGPGRMLAPEKIAALVDQKKFKGRVLITAGPTREPLDPVRYLSNEGSGKMGYALAEVFARSGAEVILVSGPSTILPPQVKKFISVKTAKEMFQAVMKEVAKADIFIATASVADFSVKEVSAQKIKKGKASLQIELTPNPDILAAVGKLKKKPFVVGFAAETENLLANAEAKLKKKACDMLVANWVGEGKGFGVDQNAATVLRLGRKPVDLPLQPKTQLAHDLFELILRGFR